MDDVKGTKLERIVDGLDIPGAFVFTPKNAGLEFICPCGCKRQGYLPLRSNRPPSWVWDGNEIAPTLTPSVLQVGGCKWHGHLRKGIWVSC